MSSETHRFSGCMVAMVTPMKADGSVDAAALERLVEFHSDQGTDAIVVAGTTGESATLDHTEHCDVVRKVATVAAGRLPVIAGTGSNATAEAIELTRCAQQAGADAALLVAPYYNKPTQEGLYRHYRAIAEAVPIPQILYNVPGRTAVDILPETVNRLADIDNIVGIKEAQGTVDRARQLIALCGDRLAVYSGDDPNACDTMLAGGQGVVSVTANVAPALMHRMCAAALAGDAAAAARYDARLAPLHRALFIEPNPIPTKWALAEMNKIACGIRLPMTWLSAAHHDTVRRVLNDLALL